MAASQCTARARLTVTAWRDYAVRYQGTRDDLIAAGVATAGMFPAGKRKCSGGKRRTPEWYAVTRQSDDTFTVTRWNGRQSQEDYARDVLDRQERAAAAYFALKATPPQTVTLRPVDGFVFAVEGNLDAIEVECASLRRLALEGDEVEAEDALAVAARIEVTLAAMSMLVRSL